MQNNTSIVLVSRGRLLMLRDLYVSLTETCELPFELLVGCDSDDKSLKEYFDIFNNYDNVKLVVDKRCFNLHTKMNSLLPLVTS